jgi:hypothetical protein
VTARDVGAIISILKDILLILLLFLLFVFETIYRLTIQSLLDSKNNFGTSRRSLDKEKTYP